MHEREAVRWLQLAYKVPGEPSQKRMWVWRRLQNLGAFSLQNSVYLLPYSEEVEKHFRQLAHEIREMGGDASIFSSTALDASDENRILQVIVEARESEYNTVIKVCSRFLGKAYFPHFKPFCEKLIYFLLRPAIRNSTINSIQTIDF